MENHKVLTEAEAEAYLSEIVDEFPKEFFKELNGGITLTQRTVPSQHGHGLYVLGSYNYQPYGLGRYIAIHYGSFVRLYGGASIARQKKALYDVLKHELTHHIESLAGVRDLEEKDRIFLAKYEEEQNK